MEENDINLSVGITRNISERWKSMEERKKHTVAAEREARKEWEQNTTLACLRMRPLLPQSIGERTLSSAVINAMEETGHIDAKKASLEAAYSLRIKPEKCTQVMRRKFYNKPSAARNSKLPQKEDLDSWQTYLKAKEVAKQPRRCVSEICNHRQYIAPFQIKAGKVIDETDPSPTGNSEKEKVQQKKIYLKHLAAPAINHSNGGKKLLDVYIPKYKGGKPLPAPAHHSHEDDHWHWDAETESPRYSTPFPQAMRHLHSAQGVKSASQKKHGELGLSGTTPPITRGGQDGIIAETDEDFDLNSVHSESSVSYLDELHAKDKYNSLTLNKSPPRMKVRVEGKNGLPASNSPVYLTHGNDNSTLPSKQMNHEEDDDDDDEDDDYSFKGLSKSVAKVNAIERGHNDHFSQYETFRSAEGGSQWTPSLNQSLSWSTNTFNKIQKGNTIGASTANTSWDQKFYPPLEPTYSEYRNIKAQQKAAEAVQFLFNTSTVPNEEKKNSLGIRNLNSIATTTIEMGGAAQGGTNSANAANPMNEAYPTNNHNIGIENSYKKLLSNSTSDHALMKKIGYKGHPAFKERKPGDTSFRIVNEDEDEIYDIDRSTKNLSVAELAALFAAPQSSMPLGIRKLHGVKPGKERFRNFQPLVGG